jgi:hypothetical protein
MTKKLLLFIILTVGLTSAMAQDPADCLFSRAKAYQVQLRVVDRTERKATAPSNYRTNNIYTWLDPALKVQNPRLPEGWWYPMYADANISGGLGAMETGGDSVVWTLTVDAFPGVYCWNPGARHLGLHALTQGLIAASKAYPEFEVAADGAVSGITTISIEDPKQEPFNGPHIVPCTIQAEDFDEGGEGVAYHDADATMQNGVTNTYRPDVSVEIENDGKNDGYHVGWTNTGEWLEYTIETTSSGKFDFIFTWASPNNTSTMSLYVDEVLIKSVNIPNTGAYDAYGEFSIKDVSMTAGKHVVKILLNHGNFDKFRIVASTTPVATVKHEEAGGIFVEDKTVHIKGFRNISSIEILNIIGKKVAVAIAPQSDIEFRLQRGIYIVRLNSENRPLIQKIIIK